MYDKQKCNNNWSQKFCNILNDLDLLERWSNNEIIPIEIAKEKIFDKFETDWRHSCSTKPKLRTYVTFKDNVEVAAHISCNLPKYERSLISQLCLGILPLRIETGRYTNLQVDQRICLLCQLNHVEDEAQFLFECELYRDERVQFENVININFDDLSLENKFRTAFEHPFRLGKFLKTAFNKRKARLYNKTDSN